MAAPQIGINCRVFLALGEVFVNPKISHEADPWKVKEACFSLHGQGGFWVQRHKQFLLSWTDGFGKEREEIFTVKKKYDMAHVIQHEFAHLEGKLINGG